MSGSNLPPASTVIDMYKSNGIKSIRLYAPDKPALEALGGTGISVLVGAPNDLLANLSSSKAAATSWVRDNIKAYPSVKLRYIAVGNEVFGLPALDHLLPAMENVHAAIAAAKLSNIKVTTSVSQEILGIFSLPSAAEFVGDAQGFMGPILRFLERTDAPLMANIYTYFPYAYNPSGMDIGYALLSAKDTVVKDGEYGYKNLFDTTVDAFYGAMARQGVSGVRVVVSESGWPSGGGKAATPANARIYNQNLIDHVKRGTPRHPEAIKLYLFSMFNENQKNKGVEQNWGLFYPNMKPVYKISLKSSSKELSNKDPDGDSPAPAPA
ncbi:Lichenase-2 [Dichanthelium oligosanthes]|uniref:Lichenase-2 n=1 Tax=Dichanthelium oligosanthes TaxID=888268 RepID=A0A1E5VGL5_9POAL|nr:Lichenase-2 [Dichanthelium oligosanthes]